MGTEGLGKRSAKRARGIDKLLLEIDSAIIQLTIESIVRYSGNGAPELLSARSLVRA